MTDQQFQDAKGKVDAIAGLNTLLALLPFDAVPTGWGIAGISYFSTNAFQQSARWADARIDLAVTSATHDLYSLLLEGLLALKGIVEAEKADAITADDTPLVNACSKTIADIMKALERLPYGEAPNGWGVDEQYTMFRVLESQSRKWADSRIKEVIEDSCADFYNDLRASLVTLRNTIEAEFATEMPFAVKIATAATEPTLADDATLFLAYAPGTYLHFPDVAQSPIVLNTGDIGFLVKTGAYYSYVALPGSPDGVDDIFSLNYDGQPTKTIITRKADKSGNTYGSSVNPNLAVWEDECYYNPNDGDSVKEIHLNARATGDIYIYWMVVVGSVVVTKHRQTVTISSTGNQSIDLSGFSVPDLSAFNQVFIGMGNVATGGPLGFRTLGSGQNSKTAAGPLAISVSGAITTSTTLDWSFWVVVRKKSALEKKIDKVDSLTSIVAAIGGAYDMDFTKDPLPAISYIPSDKTGTIFNTNALNNGSFWWDAGCVYNPNLAVPQKLWLKAASAGDIKVIFLTVQGSTATIRHIATKTLAAPGVQSVDMNDLSIPDLSAYSEIFIGLTNVLSSGNRPAMFLTTTGQNSKSCPATALNGTATVTSSTTLNFGYWVELKTKSNLELASGNISLIPGMKSDITTLQSQMNAMDPIPLVGVANYAQLVAALATDKVIRFIPGTEITISSPIVIPSDRTLIGPVKFKLANGVTTGLQINAGSRNILLEKITIEGSATYTRSTLSGNALSIATSTGIGTQKGIAIVGTSGSECHNITLRDIDLFNLDNCGLYLTYVGLPDGNDTLGVDLINISAYSCYYGIYCSTRTEYSRLTNLNLRGCTCGIAVRSGNLVIANSQFTNNTIGAYVGSGSNDSHGSFGNCAFNHNELRNILVYQITGGMSFSGCQCWASLTGSSSPGVLEINDSIGFNWVGGEISATTVLHTGKANAVNMFSSVMFKNPAVAPLTSISEVNSYHLVMKNNVCFDGDPTFTASVNN